MNMNISLRRRYFKRSLRGALVFVVMISVEVHAGIGNVVSSGRAAGNSGGLTAVADDVFAQQYNPAGLSRLAFPELAASIGSPYVGLSDATNLQQSFIGYAYPFRKFPLWKKKDELSVHNRAVAVGLYNFAAGSLYQEKIIYVSYAQEIKNRMSLGVTIKNLERSFGSDASRTDAVDDRGNLTGEKDPFFDSGDSQSAFTADLGFLYRFGEFNRYSLGFSLLNITQPDMAIGSDKDIVPLNTVAGFAYRFPKLNISLDWMRGKMLDAGNENRITTIGEKWFRFEHTGRAAVRGSLGFGSRGYRTMGLGVSYLYSQIRIDYGFSFPLSGVRETMGDHRLSFQYRFGMQDPEEYFSPELQEKRMRRRQAEREIERARLLRERAEKERELALSEIEAIKKIYHELESKKAAKKAEKAVKKATTAYVEAYRLALELFDRKKSEGLSLKKQKTFLARTVRGFSRVKVDVSLAQKMLRKVNKKFNALVDQYELTMRYYRKIVKEGASDNERLRMLKRIHDKYSRYGIEMSAVNSELEKLQ